MDGFIDKLMLVLLALVVFFALFGVIVAQTNSVAWASLNVGGTTVNLQFVPYIIILVLAVGTIIIMYKSFLGHKKGL